MCTNEKIYEIQALKTNNARAVLFIEQYRGNGLSFH